MSGTNKLIEGDQGDWGADRITDDTVEDKRSGFITPGDGVDDVSIHCKQLDDAEWLLHGDTHGVTRHGKVLTQRKPRTDTVTPEPRLRSTVRLAQGSVTRFKGCDTGFKDANAVPASTLS